MKTRAALLVGLLCTLSFAVQGSTREMWTWTDANGVTHFSDTPVPGARKIQLSGFGAPAPARSAPPAAAAPAATPRSDVAVSYRSIEIQQPAEDDSFFGADAMVNIAIQTDPALAPDHRIEVLLNGKPVQSASNSRQYTLSGLPRGTHTLSAVIQDAQGRELLRSATRTFHVRQPSVNPPAAVGPGVRPRPTPLPATRPNTSGG
jgi:hypothetical protein